MDRTQLLALEGANIPATLRRQKRWAPWKAVWNTGRGKWDKVPKRADQPEIGLSSASPELWFSFEEAMAAHHRARGMTDGIGFVMTGCTDLVGIDLDNVLDAHGQVAAWAQAIVEAVDSYTEVSPSGKGLRIFVEGHIDADWTNHHVGVEVYAGNKARFLTVTGRRLPGRPDDVLDPLPGALEWIAQQHCERAPHSSAQDSTPPMPLLLREEDLPALADLSLPPNVRDFLETGDTGGRDRSSVTAATAVALLSAGLSQAEALTLLAGNPYAFGMAMDHRSQDAERAWYYLWKHHVLKAVPLAARRMLTAGDFEALLERIDAEEEQAAAPVAPAEASMFSDLDAGSGDTPGVKPAPGEAAAGQKPVAKTGFTFLQAHDYAHQDRVLEWLIPGVVPKAELGGLYGESGSGKSFFLLDMLVSLCLKQESTWFGLPIQGHCRVAYVAAEGAIGVQYRLQAIAIDKGISLADIDLFVLGDAPNILDLKEMEELTRALKRLGRLDLVVLDTLSQVTPGANENSSEDMGRAIQHAKLLSKATGAMAFLIGHSGKDSSKGQRGWSGLKGAMDVQILLTETATYRAATVAKLKDGEGQGRQLHFKLKPVPLGADRQGLPITSAVVDPILDAQQLAEAKEHMVKAKAAKRGRTPQAPHEQAQHDLAVRAAQEACGVGNRAIDRNTLSEAIRTKFRTENPSEDIQFSQVERGIGAAVLSGELLCVTRDGMVLPVSEVMKDNKYVDHSRTAGLFKVGHPLQPPCDPEAGTG